MYSADNNVRFRIGQPKLIADAATQSQKANVYAGAKQKGQTEARDTMNTGNSGFSAGASQAMYANQQQAAADAAGRQQGAGIEAEDQQFNSRARFDNQMLRQGAMAFDYGQMSDANDAGFGYRFNNQTNRASIANARNQAQMRLRLAMLGKGLA
jgi:hypothetical protein